MKAILLTMVFILTGCPAFKVEPKMESGQCYHEMGDSGGTPRIIHCVHAVGDDGFLSCQGSPSLVTNEFRWYGCGDAEKWSWLDEDLRIVKCPKPCVEEYGNE